MVTQWLPRFLHLQMAKLLPGKPQTGKRLLLLQKRLAVTFQSKYLDKEFK